MEKIISKKTIDLLTSFSMARQSLQLAMLKGVNVSRASIGIDIRIPGTKYSEYVENEFLYFTDNDNYVIRIYAKTDFIGEEKTYENLVRLSKLDSDSKGAVRDFVDCMIMSSTVATVDQGAYQIMELDEFELGSLDKTFPTEEWKNWSPTMGLMDGPFTIAIGMSSSGAEYLDLVLKANKSAIRPDEELKSVFEGKNIG